MKNDAIRNEFGATHQIAVSIAPCKLYPGITGTYLGMCDLIEDGRAQMNL